MINPVQFGVRDSPLRQRSCHTSVTLPVPCRNTLLRNDLRSNVTLRKLSFASLFRAEKSQVETIAVLILRDETD